MKHRLTLTILAAAALATAGCTPRADMTFDVDTSREYQTIDNFGASDAWSMWMIGEMPDQTQSRVARWLFSSATDSLGNPDGIGLSIWRYNIGAGSAEQGDASQINPGTRTECFLQPDGTYDWSRQKGQLYEHSG